MKVNERYIGNTKPCFATGFLDDVHHDDPLPLHPLSAKSEPGHEMGHRQPWGQQTEYVQVTLWEECKEFLTT